MVKLRKKTLRFSAQIDTKNQLKPTNTFTPIHVDIQYMYVQSSCV